MEFNLERRASARCDICQGPTMEVSDKTSGSKKVRCRNSCCKFNHSDIECPLCQSEEISISYGNSHFRYSCTDCGKSWES